MFLSFISPCCYRLENALVLAEEFDSAVKTELRILKEFEDNLRCLGPIAEDLETIGEQLNEHKVCNLNCEFHFWYQPVLPPPSTNHEINRNCFSICHFSNLNASGFMLIRKMGVTLRALWRIE